MGIHLDWQVESDLGHQAVEEDAQVIAAQQQRRHRWRIALSAALVLLIVAGSIAWYRAKIVRDEKLRVLLATVAAEAEALRIGDKDKFMKLQGSNDAWRDEQRTAFDEMQALGVSIEVTGRILSQQISDREAEITVEIRVNNAPSQAVWLYQYTDDGWRHVDSRQDLWGDEIVERYPFTYKYNTAHQPLIDELDTILREWWAIAGAETPLDQPIEITIRIAPDYEQVRWHVDNSNTLLIPQHLLTAAHLTDPNDPLRIELAKRIANRWADRFFEENDLRSNNYNLKSEITLWLIDKFGVTPPEPYRPSIFTRLSTYFDTNIFQRFMEEWEDTDDGMIALQRAMFPDAPLSPDGASFEHFLSTYAALQDDQYYGMGLGALNEMFVTYGDNPGETLFMADYFLGGAYPGTFEVESMEMFQDVLWVRVSFDYNTNFWQQDRPPSTATRSAFIPFRRVDGAWKITALFEEDWGSPIVEDSEYVTFTYPELDAALYEGMAPYIESIYLQTAAEFDLAEIAPIEVQVKTDIMWVENDPTIIAPLIYPHRQQCCYDEDDLSAETIRKSIAQAVYYDVFNFAAGSAESAANQPSSIESALLQWAYIQHGWVRRDNRDWLSSVEVHPDVAMLNDWDDLWQTTTSYNDQARSNYYWALMDIATETLVETMFQFGGEEAFLPMVHNLRQHTSTQAWVEASLSHKNYTELEMQYMEEWWEGEFHEEVRRIFGEEAFQ